MGRVSTIFAVALLVLAVAVGATGPGTSAGVTAISTGSQENILNWPMFHHDPSRVGYSESLAPSSSNLIWSFSTGNYVYSSPAVAEDGTTYVGTAPGSGGGGSLYAINSDGTLKWSFATGGGIYSSTAIGPDNTVYVGSDDGNLYALYDNGSLKWSYNTGGFVQSSPALDANGDIYVGSSTGMFALNPDGTLKWSYASGAVTSPAVTSGRVYVGSYDDNVYCLDAENGSLIWSFTTGNIVFSSPAVTNGRVYVGSYDDNVYCLDAENGSLIWRFTTGGEIYSSPAVAYGKIFIGSRDRKVYCLGAENGTKIWSYTTSDRVWSSPAVAQGKVFVGSADYEIYCFDAENGSLIWSFPTGNFVYSSPAVAYGKLFIGSYDSKVYCFGTTYGASMLISPSYQRGPPGGLLDYTVTVVNTGGAEDTYNLTVGDNSGWALMLSENLLENVQPGENKAVTLSVAIPENAENCTRDNITVTAISQADNTIKASGSCVAHANFAKIIIYPTLDVYAFGGYSRTQLKFDISGIPSGAIIFSAKLWLYRFAADGWNGYVTLGMVENQLWNETITTSEFDAQTLTNVENYSSKFTSHGWDNLDVLSQLQVDHGMGNTYVSLRLEWASDNGDDPSSGVNNGRFLAIESQTDNLLILFNSMEYDNDGPYLEVTYVPP
jgi:outer membrane protein assembly factor BamB